jgi:hypothetical protein
MQAKLSFAALECCVRDGRSLGEALFTTVVSDINERSACLLRCLVGGKVEVSFLRSTLCLSVGRKG